MAEYELLCSPFAEHLRRLFTDCESSVFIASPYINRNGVSVLLSSIGETSREVSVRVLTSLRPDSLTNGSLDVNALLSVFARFPSAVVRSLPGLHAKTYVVDGRKAIVTSANLTNGGLYTNYEYGVLITEPTVVERVHEDMVAYSQLGTAVQTADLIELKKHVDGIRDEERELERELERNDRRRRMEERVSELNRQLLRSRLRDGRTINAIVSDTIRFLLRERPMTTAELYARIQLIHPDICDDAIDHFIDGQYFGKKWKHYVRNAQIFLKRRGDIVLRDGRWQLL